MLCILKKLTLQKELQNFATNNVSCTERRNTTTTKQKNKNPCKSRVLNTGPLALQLMRFLRTIESTKIIDRCQTI